MVQLSHPYMTTPKTIALTRWTFVGKVMSLLLNMLSRLVIAFLPRNNSFNFMAAVTICSDFGAPKIKSFTVALSCHSATPWTSAHRASRSITNSQSSLTLMSIKSVMPSNHLFLCHPLFLPSNFPNIRVFSNELVLCIRWPKYWSFNFSISPSNEYSGLISFRIDWFHLLAVQGPLKSLL